MSKKQSFIDFISPLIAAAGTTMPDDAKEYWLAFTEGKPADRPQFTDNGKIVLQFLIDHQEVSNWKAKDIAEGIGISSRSVSGCARKLCTDGYIEKLGQEPTFYCLTEKGKNVIFEN